MGDWFALLTTFGKIYWIVALVASLIFVILLILTLIGGDVEDMGDVDTDIDGDMGIGFQFLSFKNLIGFFTVFGWSGIACISAGLPTMATIGISVICGLVMMLIMASIFYYLGKLTSSGTLKIGNALHATGEVYLTIGAQRSSMGKVQIKVQGSLRELDALTDENESLTQGDVIWVSQVTDNGVLIVKKQK